MDEISKRNFHTLAEGLKDQRQVNTDQDLKIRKLEETVAMLQGQLLALQSQFWQRIGGIGIGQTERIEWQSRSTG